MIESLKLAKDHNLNCIANFIQNLIIKEYIKTKEVLEIIKEIIQKHPEHNLKHKEESSKKEAVTSDNIVIKKAKKVNYNSS